MTGENWDRGR